MTEKHPYHKNISEIENEKKLIIKTQNNPTYFAPLYDLYYLQIFNYVIKRVKDKTSAADITSDIFAKSLFKINQYKFKGLPFSSWLYRIASNEVTDFYRKNKLSKYVRVTEEQLNNLIDNSGNDKNLQADKVEKFSQIISSLEILSDKELELIEMRFFEERSFKEMSAILSITEGHARIKTHRVISKLKKNI